MQPKKRRSATHAIQASPQRKRAHLSWPGMHSIYYATRDEGFATPIFDLSVTYSQQLTHARTLHRSLQVYCSKPQSSRSSSIESFVVCKGHVLPDGYVPRMIQPLSNENETWSQNLEGSNAIIVPYLACGDLSGFNSLSDLVEAQWPPCSSVAS